MAKLVQFCEILSNTEIFVNPELIAYVRANSGAAEPSTAIGFMSGNERYVHGSVGEIVGRLRDVSSTTAS